MKISRTETSPNFRGVLNNKYTLKGLETISDHGATFNQAASFLGAALLRPAAISLTPDFVDDENKNYAKANSIASGVAKLAIAELFILPLEIGMKQVEKEPEKFLKKETIDKLKGGASSINKSKDFKFLAQCFKLGGNLVSAIPKSMLTIAMIPFLNDIFKNKEKLPINFNSKKEGNAKNPPVQKYEINPVFSPVRNSISFKGNEKIAKGIGKIIDIESVQNFAKKHSDNAHNISRDMTNVTDAVLTGTFALSVKKSSKIDEERKNPLIYNTVISTAISIVGGSALDSLVQKGSKGFIEKFKKANENNPKLSKYIEGINILRPTVIFAFIYYGLLPYFSTIMADNIDKKTKTDKNA